MTLTADNVSIVRLNEKVANQIAAGEVVERPASVVKELVENAIDAQAKRIEVSVTGGGLERICVVDDGIGFPADQVSLAFSRHATSKIRTADDLFSIHTLGFRGEALPSIASVSHVTLRTKQVSARMGTEIRLIGGRRRALEPVGMRQGTTVIVHRLFYNTPARRKFLRTESGERRAITELLTKISLAHPQLQIVYEAEGKHVLHTPGDDSIQSAAAEIYGHSAASTFLPFHTETSFGKVYGLIAPPSESKGNRQHISIFVNGRWVHSRALSVAVERGYATLLGARRFPIAMIHIAIDPSLVDVNVHPAKTEIRFKNEREIFSHIVRSIQTTLLEANLIQSETPAATGQSEGHSAPTASQPTAYVPPKTQRPVQAEDDAQVTWHDDSWSQQLAQSSDDHAASTHYKVINAATGEVQAVPDAVAESAAAVDAAQQPAQHWHAPLRRIAVEQTIPQGPPNAEAARRALQQAEPIGQVLATYMIVPVAWGLWLVDQHVAHERILFEKVLQEKDREPTIQHLLVPLTIDLSVTTVAMLEEIGDVFQAMGFVFEPFGGHSIIVRAVPSEFAQKPDTVRSIFEEITSLHIDGRPSERKERLAAMIACKGAVKAGDVLCVESMKQLLQRLAATENPFACPHGRPIIVEINQYELERRFDRR